MHLFVDSNKNEKFKKMKQISLTKDSPEQFPGCVTVTPGFAA